MSEAKHITDNDIKNLEEVLKRCPAGTLEGLLRFRETGDMASFQVFLIGCIKRHTDDEFHPLLDSGRSDLSFIDDIGIDSMTMMEIVMMIEECLNIQIDNKDLMEIRTLGELDTYIQKTLAPQA